MSLDKHTRWHILFEGQPQHFKPQNALSIATLFIRIEHDYTALSTYFFISAI